MPDHTGPFFQTLSPFQCRLVSKARSPFDATDAPQMTRRMSKSKKQFPEVTFVYFLAHNCE